MVQFARHLSVGAVRQDSVLLTFCLSEHIEYPVVPRFTGIGSRPVHFLSKTGIDRQCK